MGTCGTGYDMAGSANPDDGNVVGGNCYGSFCISKVSVTTDTVAGVCIGKTGSGSYSNG